MIRGALSKYGTRKKNANSIFSFGLYSYPTYVYSLSVVGIINFEAFAYQSIATTTTRLIRGDETINFPNEYFKRKNKCFSQLVYECSLVKVCRNFHLQSWVQESIPRNQFVQPM